MNTFLWARFVRVFTNDVVLLNARKVGMITLALMGIGLVIYLLNVGVNNPGQAPLSEFLFPAFLFGGGALFTSMIFGDMHHPLERFHFLTLPCSAFERFVSRYLITAPLYFLYAIVVYFLFEQIAKIVCLLLLDETFVPFNPLSPLQGDEVLAYLTIHAFAFAGAIHFRSHALLRTIASLFMVWAAWILVFSLAIRILFWDSFISLYELDPAAYLDIDFPFLEDENGPTGLFKTLLAAFMLWVLYLGYLGLREHEVQDGL